MTKDETKSKKPKSPPFTLASLYLAAGLAVCFILLTRLIPATAGVLDERMKKHDDSADWHDLAMSLSQWVSNHQSVCITAFAIIAIAGLMLPFLVRPSRYLIWVAALVVFFLDVTLVVIGVGHMLSGLLKEAGNLGP